MARYLLNLVNAQLNAGSTVVVIPGWLLAETSEDEVMEIRRLCALNGARIEVRN
ncbi:hypothetical protein JXD38_05785 [candidate division WOR-3 bacterium]|nr:hypothetical protein [candidate division WOR-3 bacterium]